MAQQAGKKSHGTRPHAARPRERGLGLLVVAAALVMAGAAAVVGEATHGQAARDHDARQTTAAKLRRIETALVRFVERHGRLPCPADGTEPVADDGGRESVTRTGGSQTDCGSLDLADGVVPWGSLGLGPEYAVDAWGQRIGYAVSDGNVAAMGTVQTRDDSLVQPNGMNFLACLDAMGGGGTDCLHGVPDPVPLNAVLTDDPAFDPSNPDQELEDLSAATQQAFMEILRRQVMDDLGVRVIDRDRDVAKVDPEPEATDVADDAEPRAPGLGAAFVLISHGENGLGARTPAGAQTVAAQSAAEEANVDGDGDSDFATFQSTGFNGGLGNGAFDDMLRTVAVRDLAGEAGLWRLPDNFIQQVHILAEGEPGPCNVSMADFLYKRDFTESGGIQEEEGDGSDITITVDVVGGDGPERVIWDSSRSPLRMQAKGGPEFHLALGSSGAVTEGNLGGKAIGTVAFCEGVGDPSEEPNVGGGNKDTEGGDNDKGHGNDPDGFDDDNPGQSKGVGNGQAKKR